MDELNDLSADILLYTYELQELSLVLQSLDADLVKKSTPENQVFMHESLDRYKKICDKLRICLEAYFSEEKRLDMPTYITFQKLYRSIKAVS